MSLGVLNNLAAIHAENSLNNTNSSLNTVLQQLSSGSKINSGADDAAGLSLVDGLRANSMALTQSQTNATEGVGLLTVADGALSQVTNLLNRAVTLATEASNGTLNSSQDTAANQEYQSILSEINNIGTTTTYNQQSVFGAGTVNIYTGDSSTTGASIDSLNIRTLSSSNVGDTGGVMSYSNGANNVFLNLSSSSANAAATDYLTGGAAGNTSLTVNYLVKGATGASTTASTTINVGANTNYSNTANGLMSAINNSGLGLTANFSTQAAAGVQGGGTQTGIEISGGLVSAGVAPSSASTSGMLGAAGIPASELLTNGQQVTVSEGGTQVATVTVGTTANVSGGGTVNTLQELAASINNQAGAGTASVVTNGDGSQSLALADNGPNGALSVATVAGAGPSAVAFTGNTPGSATTVLAAYGSAVTGNAATPATNASVTFGVSGTNAATDVLSAGGSITLKNSATGTALTFKVGAGTNTATTFFTANNTSGITTNTIGGLAEAIHEQAATLGADAAAGPSGIKVTASTAQTNLNITASANSLTNANATIGLYNPTEGGAAVTGTATVTALDAGVGTLANDTLNLGGVITLSNGNTAQDFTYVATAGQKISDLVTAITGSGLGVTASFSGGAILMTQTAGKGANPITVVGTNTLQDTTLANTPSLGIDAYNAGAVVGVAAAPATYGTAALQLNNGGTITDLTDNLTGKITLNNGAGVAQTIIMGAGTSSGTTYYTGANTVNSLVSTIDGIGALGMKAVEGGNAAGSLGSIYLQSTATGTTIGIAAAGNTLADAANLGALAPVSGVTAIAGQNSVTTVGTAAGNLSTTDALASGGSIVLANAANSGLAANQYTFTVGTGNSNVTVGNTTTLAAGSTLADLATAISGISALGVTATANTHGLNLSSTAFDANQIKVIGSSTMADAAQGSAATDTLGSFASANDTISGTLAFTGGNGAQSITLAQGATVQSLVNQIHAGKAAYGVDATLVNGANGAASILLTSTTESGTISGTGTTSITDTATTANLSWTPGAAYNVGISGAVGDQNTSQAAASFVSDTSGGKGTATISYTDGAGQSLSSTDLTNQTDAQAALNALNSAITDVAAQDGYIGAQINTLNAVSQVLSTQSENVVSAQNAVQATDYASATSNMSKYEILSQTGISALAQANSMQQEVTKLLQ